MMETRHRQTIVPHAHGVLRLSVSDVLSPYFQLTDTRRVGTGRDTKLSLKTMNRIGIIEGYQTDGNDMDVLVSSWDDTTPFAGHGTDAIFFALGGATDPAVILGLAKTAANAFATTNSFTFSALKAVWEGASIPAMVFSNPSLAVNTARQPSTTVATLVNASVDITANLTLTTGQKGTVTLQYADDSGFTTNVKTAHVGTNGNTGTLAIGLSLGQTVTAALSGVIPAGKYYRLLTTQNTGTPTFGTPAIQEVSLY